MPKLNLPNPKHIPIFSVPDKPLIDTTQTHVPVADIVENLVVFKNGAAAIVMESTSLNFGLLSDQEQEAVISAYAALINSLSFPIQIVVRTQKKDITSYLKFLGDAYAKIQNQKLKILMASYRNFISETIKTKKVLGKRFFIVIPFSQYELGVAKSFLSVTKGKGPLPFTKEYVIQKAQISLFPKRDHLIRQAARLGLKLKTLNKEELVILFEDYYNPSIEKIGISKQPQQRQ
jgi:hypothetical protein